MKRINYEFILLLALTLLFTLMLSGCGDKTGNTIDEPKITSNYLEDEYAQQLVTDGAETILGHLAIVKGDDSYSAHISEREIVPNSDYDDGYYIADTNLTKDAVLSSNVRIVCFENNEPVIVTADEFIEKLSDDSNSLYTVYLMGNTVELILATDPYEVIGNE